MWLDQVSTNLPRLAGCLSPAGPESGRGEGKGEGVNCSVSLQEGASFPGMGPGNEAIQEVGLQSPHP